MERRIGKWCPKYSVYYDQAGKAQNAASELSTTGYADNGLTNGQSYCYKVTSSDSTCESGFSNILCATPTQPGQTAYVAVTEAKTGHYVMSGKGKKATTTFSPANSFSAGDTIVIRATVTVQNESGNPVPNATVAIAISGPESVTRTSGPSDADGTAEVSWQTRKRGTATGSYSASITGVSASGYSWNNTAAKTNFTVQ